MEEDRRTHGSITVQPGLVMYEFATQFNASLTFLYWLVLDMGVSPPLLEEVLLFLSSDDEGGVAGIEVGVVDEVDKAAAAAAFILAWCIKNWSAGLVLNLTIPNGECMAACAKAAAAAGLWFGVEVLFIS